MARATSQAQQKRACVRGANACVLRHYVRHPQRPSKTTSVTESLISSGNKWLAGVTDPERLARS